MGQRPFDVARTRVTLFEALLRSRRASGGKTPILEDHDRKVLTYDDIVRAAFALGGRLKGLSEPGERLGILLPTGVGATVTFFAVHAAGRTPAMLNFTAGAMNIRAACQAAGVKTVLTARKFVEAGRLEALIEEMDSFVDLVFLEDVREKLTLADKLGALFKGMFARSFAPKGDPDDVGVILFTSGSFGTPRGAVLTHANIVANVEQCYAHVAFDPDWSFFNPLPMFHCFGLTGGTLLPLLTGHKTFLYPSPLHAKEIVGLVKDTGANVMLATDTFAMQYARASRGGELSTLKLMVLGAEKVKEETRAVYERKFGTELLEGYGATEASPVIAVNQPGMNRHGTVGKMLPGMDWRLEAVPGISEGQKLLVKGPNVMKGYLDPSGSGAIEPLADGWHDTGDVVDVDADGFVTIVGRVKRFAKIGGECVSLNAVEWYAQQVWPEHNHAAVSVPDSRKGERIVLFSDKQDAEPGPLIEWAQSQGAPEIAVPKKIVPIREIPVLGSGKTDYVALQRLAEQEATREAA
ncbi:MAG: AMP-binding protein [Hydrogenophilaceae bacterium]|jgi:acyl-[acyl-carrier-protein]-phospholipid O-acyltransferase/long-chain-fatty-acid--[acyl-carrier-protein] ligase|nr:AMP-binding protein [Hydrogenophilaceae bacterium]